MDVGTSFCKAVVYDSTLRELAVSRRQVRTCYPRPGWAEQNPLEWWEDLAICIKEALDAPGVSRGGVKGIGVCGQSRGMVLVDENLSPVAPFIPWLDTRAVEQARRIETVTGREVSPYSAAAKLLWIRENIEGALERTRFLLPCKDYIRAMLTGRIATDPSDAWATGLFDMSSRRWNRELLRLIGVDEALLPPLLEPWELAGSLSERSSHEIGLREGTPVVTGAGDALCTLIAFSEVLSEARVGLYLGSSPGIFALSDLSRRARAANSWELSGRRFTGVFLSAVGVGLDWLKTTARLPDYEALDSEAEAAERGSGGLLLLPRFSGERALALRPQERASVLGLSVGHEIGHIARATMEGAALQLRHVVEELGIAGFVKEVVLSGGGSKSRIWRRILSNVLGVPNFLLDRTEASAFGAASLAAVGSGAFGDLRESLRASSVSLLDGVFPNPSDVKFYEHLYVFYRRANEMTSTVFDSGWH